MPYPRNPENPQIVCSRSVPGQDESESERRGEVLSEDAAQAAPVLRHMAFGHMSLFDMLNCSIYALSSIGAQLMLEQLVRNETPIASHIGLDLYLSADDRERVEGWLKIISNIANDFEWQAVLDRISIIRETVSKGTMTQRRLATEYRVLRETIEFGSKFQAIYRYPNSRAIVFKDWKKDWKDVLTVFPTSSADIWSGVDTWALGHNTASVFHFMRVLEHGLRALALDVGRTFDKQQWHNIIDEIEKAIKLNRELPKSEEKDARLSFLSQAAAEFRYFKDGWRNYVSHGGGLYDEHTARSVMEHVRSFMMIISTRLQEDVSEQSD